MIDHDPVVLIHGLFGDLRGAALAETLSPVRWLAPDLLGYGVESAAPAPLDLDRQVEHVHRLIANEFTGRKVHLAGHSMGGVIAMLLAHRHPDEVASVITIEGNFTLKDAFWSAAIAAKSPDQVAEMMATFRADPAAWLGRSGIGANDHTLAIARSWLARQPDATIHAMAKAIVAATETPQYLVAVRQVFDRHPVHLIAGERSAAGWDVPDWARAKAASSDVIAGVGHMMMLEAPDQLAAALRRAAPSIAGP